MISIISPAKTLDMSVPVFQKTSNIRFPKETNSLKIQLKKFNPAALGKLMHISDKLAILNADRYKSFNKVFDESNSRCALLCFKGDVYLGLDAASLDSNQMDFAQDHLRILSGLYGLLRPLDMMQAYRLEMSTKLSFRKYKNLYEFWGNKITNLLKRDLDNSGSNVLINLASKEYFKAINTKKLKARIINIHFKEYKNEELKFISFNAKKARGFMSRFIIEHKITNPNDLIGFDTEGYYYEPSLSDEENWIFVR